MKLCTHVIKYCHRSYICIYVTKYPYNLFHKVSFRSNTFYRKNTSPPKICIYIIVSDMFSIKVDRKIPNYDHSTT